MTRENARQVIKEVVKCTDYLTKSKGSLYCCPFCKSGMHDSPDSDGALEYHPETNSFYCYSCHEGGDIFKLYQQVNKTDFNTALADLAQSAGITIDQYMPGNTPKTAKNKAQGATKETTEDNADAAQEGAELPNFIAYYKTCRQRISDPEAMAYLKSRGISEATAAAYWIGYDPKADPASAPGAASDQDKRHPCKRIIIPVSESYYIARSIEPETPKQWKKMNPKDIDVEIFNKRALFAQDVQKLFITEGIFDALAIIEAGSPAIALNGAGNADKLIKELEAQRTDATLILCLDNDDAGRKSHATLTEGLQRLNISYITADICKGCKDPNEALTKDREGFIKAVDEAQRTALRPENIATYFDKYFLDEVSQFKREIKTGFTNLDAQIGGLYPGLYAIAAISSLGKTTFALQLADQLAESGEEVIIFSLEQSRLELASKSIARRLAQNSNNFDYTSLSIRRGEITHKVKQTIDDYKTAVGERLNIVEGNFNCNSAFICDYIREYTHRTKARPIVFIDYLQILQPTEEEKAQAVRQHIDNTVTELKRLSRELDLTIFIISSVNRANYLTPIDFESLKESGGIEYTCDAIFGLQFQCLDNDIFNTADKTKTKQKREEIKKAKAANPRKIELVGLKNRYGKANFSCYFDYYPANDLFKVDEEKEEFAGDDWRSRSNWQGKRI